MANINGLLGNPMFQAGMGLLANRYDSRINPYASAMNGVNNAAAYQMMERQRRQEDEDRARYEKAIDELTKVVGPTAPVAMGPPGPQGMNMQPQPNPNYDPMAYILAQAGDLGGAVNSYNGLRTQLDPTAEMRNFAYRQQLPPDQAALWDQMNARTQNTPASLQEMDWLLNATDAQRDTYWKNKRASQLVETGGGGTSALDPEGNLTPVVTPEDATGRQADLAAAEQLAKDRADAAAKLPGFKAELDSTSEFIDRLIQHPGRTGATGKSGWFNPLFLPGSDRRDFMALLETAQGKQFAVAYETLKGGGAITQIETEQATRALGNLTTAQSDGQFQQALEDFRSAMQRGYDKLAARAGVASNSPQPQGTVLRFDAQGNRIP